MYAPIVVFAFNRLDTLKACIGSLQHNKLFDESDLIVYVDGPRANKEGEADKVEAVRQYVQTISGAKSLTWHFSEQNKGLAASIIGGVTEVINQYGKVIVVEDDLYLSPSFLVFMNQMLQHFEHDERVFQVSGYSALIKRKTDSDVYFNGRGQCWSWGTWKDRWEKIDWEIKDFEEFNSDSKKRKEWASFGHDLYGMLNSWKKGRLNSWWIRFSYNMFKLNRYAVCPTKSLVRNDGFGADSTHCNVYDRYKIDFNDENIDNFYIPENLEWSKAINRHATRYWSLPYRVYGKMMTEYYRKRVIITK